MSSTDAAMTTMHTARARHHYRRAGTEMPPIVQQRNTVMQEGCVDPKLLEHDKCRCEMMVGDAARDGIAVSQAGRGAQMLRAGEAVMRVC